MPRALMGFLPVCLLAGLCGCESEGLDRDVRAVSAKNCESHFTKSVQPELDYCRSCHVPGGVADVPEGRRFMLRNEAAEDFSRLRESWERLGRNDSGPSLILTMAAGSSDRSHSGGAPWPPDSEAYRAMEIQLEGFEDPAACPAS